MRRTSTIPLAAVLLSLLAAGARADRYKVKKCDATAAAEIAEGYKVVTDNLNAMLGRMTFLSAEQRDKVRNRWGDLKATCADDRLRCENKDAVAGFAHGGLGNRVNICYYNMVALAQRLCDLVEVVVHEKGHADNIPHLPGHNSPTPTIRATDLVYRMGTEAGAECRTRLGAGDRALRGEARLDLGRVCTKDAQCASDKCEKDRCTCKRDDDCEAGQKCKNKPFGANECK